MTLRNLVLLSIYLTVHPIKAQSIGELVVAVQERKIALLQREAVKSELAKSAEEQADGSSNLPVVSIDPGRLVQWGYGLPPLPPAPMVQGLSVGAKLDVLNRAVREIDRIKTEYLNLDARPGSLLYDELGKLNSLPSLGAVTEANWRNIVMQLASQLEQMVALDWPMACQTSYLDSKEVSSSSGDLPGPPPAASPGFPFIVGGGNGAQYKIARSITTANQVELYRWHGGGNGYGDGVDIESGVNAVTSISSKIASGSPIQGSIAGGRLTFFKQAAGRSIVDETSAEYLQSPKNFWRPVEEETNSFVWGEFAGSTSVTSSLSELTDLEGEVRSKWQIPAMYVGEGHWHLLDSLWFMYGYVDPKHGPLPYNISFLDASKLASRSYSENLRCVCFPAFTAMSGSAARRLSSPGTMSAGEVEAPIGEDKIQIHLGGGRYDRHQVAWLDSRMDGFGSPILRGSANAFKVILEYKKENFPHRLVLEDYPPEEEFTPEESGQTGWTSKWQYLSERNRPRLRQIYGSDVVVDIVYLHDYRKEIRFFWAKDVTVNPDTLEAPATISGSPFKTIVLENATTGESPGFPQSKGKLHILDGELHLGVENETGSEYLVTGGRTKGMDDLFSRTITPLSSSKFRETYRQGTVSWVTETEYYEWRSSVGSLQVTFDRFSRNPFPVQVSQGGRSVGCSAAPYPAPLTQFGEPDYHESYFPISGIVTCAGQDWDMDGAEVRWNENGTRALETRTIAGNLHQITHTWNGSVRTSSHTLAGQNFQTETATYSADMLQLTQSTGAGDTVISFDTPNGTAPWSLKQIVESGGHRTQILRVPDEEGTALSIQEGWGPGYLSGTYRYVTTNRWGGLMTDETWVTTTIDSVQAAGWTGSQHTGWGQPSQMTGMQGEQFSTTFNSTGRAWGLPTSWTSPHGIGGSVSGYDALLRPTSINTGFSSLTPDYSNPLQMKVAIAGQGTVTEDLTSFGEMTHFNDTRPGGVEIGLTPGSGFVKVDGRQAGLDVSSAREVLGRESGMGSRGVVESYGVEGGRLCVTTTSRTQANGAHFVVKTFYDGQGRVVKITRPGPDGGMVSESWVYDDANRSVRHIPVPGPSNKEVTQTLSADGGTLTVEEQGGAAVRYIQGVDDGQLVVTTQLLDDSSGTSSWVQFSKQGVNPATGQSRFTPWDLAAATVQSTVPPASATMNITGGGGIADDESHLTLSQGRPSSLQGRSRGVPYNLDQWSYQNERLTGVSGNVGGKSMGLQLDSQGRLARSWGPGYDKSYLYSGAPGFQVQVTDSVQGTQQVLKASAAGDLTERSGDVAEEIFADTLDLANGQTSTTLNSGLTLKQAVDGSFLQKDYGSGLVENRSYKADGSLLTFGAGPEAASVSHGPGDRVTAQFSGGLSVVENFYTTGLRRDVSGPNDDRRYKYLRGRVNEEKHEAGVWANAVMSYTQDGKGRVDGAGVSGPGITTFGVGYAYDNYSRLSGVGGATYQYDGQGRLYSCTRDPLTTTWFYDAQGRIDRVETVNDQGPDLTFEHGYNPRNLRVTRTATGGQSWTGMIYDNQGRLKRTHLSNGTVLNYAYDARGNRLSGGGMVTYTVNGLDQVTGRELGQRGYGVAGSVVPGARIRVFHPLAPAEGEEITVDPSTGVYQASWTVASDWNGGGVSRVEMLVRGTLEGAGTGGRDAVADKQVWVVVPANQETLEYDGAGRLIGDSEWVYTWNGMRHLTGMFRKANTSIEPELVSEGVVFQYDADGRRTVKLRTRTYQNAAPRVEGSQMLWDGWLPVLETRQVDGVDLLQRRFVWGRDVSGSLGGAGGIGGLLEIVEVGGRTLLPVDDGLGNIVAVINQANGDTVARFEYGPYGELVSQSGEVAACPFRYQSKYCDEETGLSYFGYRYYSAKLGRWISRDPLGEAGGFNLYAYCGNDPVNRWDYLGMADGGSLRDGMQQQMALAIPPLAPFIWFKQFRQGYIDGIDAQLQDLSASRVEKIALQKKKGAILAASEPFQFTDAALDVVISPGTAGATFDNFVDGFYQLSTMPGGGLGPAGIFKSVIGINNIKVFQYGGLYEEDSAEDYSGKMGAVLVPLPPIANASKPLVRAANVVEGWSPRVLEFMARQRSLRNLQGGGFEANVAAKTLPTTSSTAIVPYYPPANGVAGATTREFLMPGRTIDRFGGSGASRFFSPTGTSEAARALPPGTAGQTLRTFEVMKPFEVESGTVATWFNQPGGGTQFRTPVPLETLLKRGILKEQ